MVPSKRREQQHHYYLRRDGKGDVYNKQLTASFSFSFSYTCLKWFSSVQPSTLRGHSDQANAYRTTKTKTKSLFDSID